MELYLSDRWWLIAYPMKNWLIWSGQVMMICKGLTPNCTQQFAIYHSFYGKTGFISLWKGISICKSGKIGNIKFSMASNKYFAFQQNFKNFAITNEGPEKWHANASTLFFCLVLSNNIVHLFYFLKLRKLGEEQRNLPAWVTTAMVYQMVVVYQSPQQPK